MARSCRVESCRKHVLPIVGVTLFAWLLREYFINATIVDLPIRGDVRDYVLYAVNLLQHGVFSHASPSAEAPVPDAFRGPGYPWFLFAWMWLDQERWYALALHAQAVVGALTATATILLGRHWLPWRWALASGLLIAVWPHHVVATASLLTEVWLGFLLTVALLLSAIAIKLRSTTWVVFSGVTFSLAALTSLVSLPFPVVMGLIYWRECLRKLGLILVMLGILGPTLWGIREIPESIPGTPSRVEMNVVQGSWPGYHDAYLRRHDDPAAMALLNEIEAEEQALAMDPRAGIRQIGRRLANESGRYAAWYLLEKPFLLWDWDIRMGAGDVYFHPPHRSPWKSNPTLRALKRGLEMMNPLMYAGAVAAVMGLLAGWLVRAPWAGPTATATAAFFAYITVVHVVFQAEPRYSIAYRPMEMLMSATSLWVLASIWSRSRP